MHAPVIASPNVAVVPSMTICRVDLYWLAGLLEGEGTFLLSCYDRTKGRFSPVIRLAMTDEDVVQRVGALWEKGVHRYVRKKYPHWKPLFVTTITGLPAARFMGEIYALMGVRRQAKILEILAHRPHYHPRRPWGVEIDSTLSVDHARANDEDFHWLAGIIEGEGCFYRCSIREKKFPSIILSMTDKDVVERVGLFFGVKPHARRRSEKWQPQYTVRLVGFKAESLMRRIYPLLSVRRQAKIAEVLRSW